MAEHEHITSIPQQPELRAFVTYTELPARCVAFPITTTDSYPHLRPGEVAVVDTTLRDPQEHELFVIQYGEGRYAKRCVVELWTNSSGWFAGAYCRSRQRYSPDNPPSPVDTADGPYPPEGEEYAYLCEKLVGQVVGILEPAFDEPMRVAA